MPSIDLGDSVKAAVAKNKEIPAMLDAYGEFVDSQIGPLELSDLQSVFARVLDNLMQRFPEVASKRASSAALNDILSFLTLANNEVEQIKEPLRKELSKVSRMMGASIAERFARMGSDERRAIDATLRLIKRSTTEILFKAETGKQLSTSGREYERFFAAVKSEAPSMRELRYENLIVEKGIFNKLLLKTEKRDYSIWVPSMFARDNVDFLIDKVAVPSEQILLTYLKQLKDQGTLDDRVREFLAIAIDSLGVVQKPVDVPELISGYVEDQINYVVMTPLDLDDAARFLEEEDKEKLAAIKAEQERHQKEEEEALRRDEERRAELVRQRRKQVAQINVGQQAPPTQLSHIVTEESVYLGKQIDAEQLISAISRRVQEKDLPLQVKSVGDFFLDGRVVKTQGVAIVGSSGSGRSTTLRRLLDGLGSAPGVMRLMVVDQKGEHRGLAWKYRWEVCAFAKDSQAREFRVPLFPKGSSSEESSELVADLLQEWVLQAGLNCTDQQRARISSIIKAQHGSSSIENVVAAMNAEPELAQLGQKLTKNFLGKGSTSKMFGEEGSIMLGDIYDNKSILFDISGRGLRDPTTKEERQLVALILLREMLAQGVKGCIIVLEDMLDRLKGESIKKRARGIVAKLIEAGNSFVVTSRGPVREFLGADEIEILHRLSGEKAISEELSGFRTDIQARNLADVVAFLPRGYVLTSKYSTREGGATLTVSSSAVKVEPLQFS